MRVPAFMILIMMAGPACGKRSAVPLPGLPIAVQSTTEEISVEEPPPPPTVITVQEPIEKPVTVEARVKAQDVALRFTHAVDLCATADAKGNLLLQACVADAENQKFALVPALDGRIQIQNVQTKLCLASGGDRFSGFVVSVVKCSADSSQFFTRVAVDRAFALRQESASRCAYAENGAKIAGTRIVMFPCADDGAQRLLAL